MQNNYFKNVFLLYLFDVTQNGLGKLHAASAAGRHTTVQSQKEGMKRIQVALAVMFGDHNVATTDRGAYFNGLSREDVLQHGAFRAWNVVKQTPKFRTAGLAPAYDLEAAALMMKFVIEGSYPVGDAPIRILEGSRKCLVV